MVVQAVVRVIYGDTDAMGQAYYGNYLKWFEVGRAEWFRSSGMSYRQIEERGLWLPVVEAHCTYCKPAFYDDILNVGTWFSFSGPARLRFDYEIRRDGDLLTSGYTVHVCMKRDRRVVKPPGYLKILLDAAARPPVADPDR
ncbi:MAG: acyl-CoA thioesterase [Syntrophobacteraceae bacterium]|nr:acyl-CoA thioesterase [Syntrophobacteraceae bacterium]